mmetsp:Transcript_81489/g.263989  ORF Transcript_81489/g.263989 Transcript_81489/m.263989 type:complete len:297 (+) Transcript_81489:62-952(+)
MEASRDPALMRIGIHLGSMEDVNSASKLVMTLHEILARTLNLMRLAIVAGPVLIQSCYIHTVGFSSWFLRLLAIYALAGGIGFLAAPEQAYSAMALKQFRRLFELFYPDLCSRSPVDREDACPSLLLQGCGANQLSGKLVQLRLQGTNRYLSLTQDGWAVFSDHTFAVTFLLQHMLAKGDKVPDTYTFCVKDPALEWDGAHLSATPVNQLRMGGWLGAFRDMAMACPYKIVQDSSCAPGACKLLSACPHLPRPMQRFSTGFYMAEQLCGGWKYVGFAQDKDAAMVEIVAVETSKLK